MKRLTIALMLFLVAGFSLVQTAKAQLVAKNDSLCLSIFVGDSLNNPANLAADTFVVVIMSPGGDSIMAVSGPPATAGLNVDSLTLKTLGRMYHWAKKVDDIDAIIENGLYEIRFCAKKNSPLYVSCQVLHYQIVDSTVNTLFYGATVADIAKEVERRSAAFANILSNGSFEDTITATTYNFWTLTSVGTGLAKFSSLMSTFGSAGYYACRLYTNASGDSAYFRSMPIFISTPGAYLYGGSINQGGLHAGDSAVVGLVTNNTFTYADSLPLGELAAGTLHWYRFERKVYLAAGTYQMLLLSKYRTPATTVYFDDVFLRRIPTDSAGVAIWNATQRDSVLACIAHIQDSLHSVQDSLDRVRDSLFSALAAIEASVFAQAIEQDSMYISLGIRKNCWTKASKHPNADTLFEGIDPADTSWARIYYHAGGVAGQAPDSTKTVWWP